MDPIKEFTDTDPARTAGPGPDRPATPDQLLRRYKTRQVGRRALLAGGLGALAAIPFAFRGSPPAMAGPQPLHPELAGSMPTLTELVAAADFTGRTPTTRASHRRMWALSMDADQKRSRQLEPEEILTWQPNPTEVATATATVPADLGEQPLLSLHGGEAKQAQGPAPRREDRTLEQVRALSTFPDQPSQAPAILKEQVERFHPGAMDHAHTCIDAIASLSNEWTLDADTSRQVLLLLAAAPDLTATGRLTDRLGRPAVAFEASDTARGSRLMALLDERTAELLGIESMALREQPELGLAPGNVMMYTAYYAPTPLSHP